MNRIDIINSLKADVQDQLNIIKALESTDQPTPKSVADVRKRYADRTPATASVPRQRVGRASVNYEMLPKFQRMNAADIKGMAESMPAAYAAVFKVLAKSRKPLTAKELESASGMVKKTVESALWQLRRTYKVARSVAID